MHTLFTPPNYFFFKVLLDMALLITSVTHLSLAYPIWTYPPDMDSGSPYFLLVIVASHLSLTYLHFL